jgi:hypothetical protein
MIDIGVTLKMENQPLMYVHFLVTVSLTLSEFFSHFNQLIICDKLSEKIVSSLKITLQNLKTMTLLMIYYVRKLFSRFMGLTPGKYINTSFLVLLNKYLILALNKL